MSDQGNLLICENYFLMNFFCVEIRVTILLLRSLKALLKGLTKFTHSR